MKRNFAALAGFAVFLMIMAAAGFTGSRTADETPVAGLDDVFSAARGMVRDTNGDALSDLVAARIVVPAKPSPEDILAATHVAARIGYETLAMSLPLVVREDETARLREIALPILIGRENAVIKKLAGENVIDVKTLKAGQGLIAWVASPYGGPDGLAIVGGDEEGTLAAANVLAARLPRLWSMTGITLSGIEEQALRYLRSKGISASGAGIRSLVVDSDRRGIARVDLRIHVAAADALDILGLLHDNGLFRTALSFDHVEGVAVDIVLKDARAMRLVKNSGTAPPSNIHEAHELPKGPLVSWDHIISPAESEDIIHKLSAYPEVKAYKAGVSYRGRDVSVLEITAPTGSELVSLAKMTAYKPTILITGRQHANEVSSTSHILRLAELLVTDPSYKEILKKVNVILHPVENPDGAQMAYDLQKITPNYMLHAGRYSALGTDVGSQVGQADPLLPEALVRPRMWREWLPDICLNPHGYPSHEWVQQFAGYVPPGFRSYLFSLRPTSRK